MKFMKMLSSTFLKVRIMKEYREWKYTHASDRKLGGCYSNVMPILFHISKKGEERSSVYEHEISI